MNLEKKSLGMTLTILKLFSRDTSGFEFLLYKDRAAQRKRPANWIQLCLCYRLRRGASKNGDRVQANMVGGQVTT